eukprot:jgi/Antlo1/2179/1317
MQLLFKLLIIATDVLGDTKNEYAQTAKQPKSNGIPAKTKEESLFEKIQNVVSEFNEMKLTTEQSQGVEFAI